MSVGALMRFGKANGFNEFNDSAPVIDLIFFNSNILIFPIWHNFYWLIEYILIIRESLLMFLYHNRFIIQFICTLPINNWTGFYFPVFCYNIIDPADVKA